MDSKITEYYDTDVSFLHHVGSCNNSIIRLPSHLKSVLKMTREQGTVNRDRDWFQSMVENLS